jgi:ribonuclease P protein component
MQQTRVITRFFSQPTERQNETHLSTFGYAAKAASRFSGAHAYPWRQGRHQCTTSQGAGPSGGVIEPRATLPRALRLRGAAQFTGRFSQRLRGHFFLVLARKSPLQLTASLGVVVSRRVAPRAVDRAVVRRLVREEFRQIRHTLPPLAFIVRARRGIPAGERVDARQELRALFGRVHHA